MRINYKSIFFLCIFLTLLEYGQSNGEAEKLYLKRITKDASLIMPEKMKDVLKKYNSKFVLWKLSDFLSSHVKQYYRITSHQAPFAVIGDFNGDGIPDVALFGHDDQNDLIVCVLSGRKGYEAIEVEKMKLFDPSKMWTGTQRPPEFRLEKEYGLDDYLFYHAKGKVDFGESGSFDLKTDSFELNIQLKGEYFYYWKNGKFNKFVSGC